MFDFSMDKIQSKQMKILLYTLILLWFNISFPAKLNAQVITTIEMPDSIYLYNYECNKDIQIDHTGNIWLATYGGLVKMDSDINIMNFYKESNSGLPHFFCQALAVDTSNHIWIGSAGGVLAEFDGIESWVTYSPYYDVTGIKINKNNHVWFHSWNSGICHYDRSVFNWYNTQNSEIPSDDIFDIEIQDDTIIWIASMESGLIKFHNNEFYVFDTINSELLSNVIYGIEIDSNNFVYCGTDNGMCVFDGNNWQNLISVNEEIQIKRCNPYLVDSDNYVWFVTEDSESECILIRYKNDDDFRVFDAEQLNLHLTFSPWASNEIVELYNDKFAIILKTENNTNITIIDFCSGNENIVDLDGLSVYPIPSSNYVYCSNDEYLIKSISIYGINGSLVKCYDNINSEHYEINIENCKPGVYFLITTFSEDRRGCNIILKI